MFANYYLGYLDLLHIFSFLPRELNFLEHTSNIGWKENQRAWPVIVDPGLYHSMKSGVFWAKERRSIPRFVQVVHGIDVGGADEVISRILSLEWDNLPCTFLMYCTNFLSSPEGYFHTVACSRKDHQNMSVNHNLHYMRWDSPPKANPINLTLEHYNDMVQSGAPFTSTFARDDPVLNKTNKELLRRPSGQFTLVLRKCR